MIDYLEKRGVDAEITTVPKASDVIKRLAEGRHAGGFLPRKQGLYFVRKFDLSEVKSTEVEAQPRRTAFAVRNENTELLADFNKGLSKLQEKEGIQQLREKWFSVYRGRSYAWYLRVAAWIAGGLAVVGLALVLWVRLLRGQVRRKTRQLEE